MNRKRPPDRRDGELVTFQYGNLKYHAQFSRDDSGEVCEMFLNVSKDGTAASFIARECAVILSISRQYGVPMSVISAALPKLHNGRPAGPVGRALFLIKNPKFDPDNLDNPVPEASE